MTESAAVHVHLFRKRICIRLLWANADVLYICSEASVVSAMSVQPYSEML
jgi:hypothetical protein